MHFLAWFHLCEIHAVGQTHTEIQSVVHTPHCPEKLAPTIISRYQVRYRVPLIPCEYEYSGSAPYSERYIVYAIECVHPYGYP